MSESKRKKAYEKPEVVSSSTPEVVEAGCCLTSCGGSPAASLGSTEKRSDQTNKDKAVVRDAQEQMES